MSKMAERFQSTAMGTYRFFVVNRFDEVLSSRELECAGDADATAMAASLMDGSNGIEVWDIGQRIAKLSNE